MTISASVIASGASRRASVTRLANPGSTVNSTAHHPSRLVLMTDFEALSPVSGCPSGQI